MASRARQSLVKNRCPSNVLCTVSHRRRFQKTEVVLAKYCEHSPCPIVTIKMSRFTALRKILAMNCEGQYRGKYQCSEGIDRLASHEQYLRAVGDDACHSAHRLNSHIKDLPSNGRKKQRNRCNNSRRLDTVPPFRGAGPVGGRVPDKWSQYVRFHKYFVVPQLRIKGVLPCKTFLDRCFDEKIIQITGSTSSQIYWHTSNLLESGAFEEAPTADLDSHRMLVASTFGEDSLNPSQDQNEREVDDQCYTLVNNPLVDKDNDAHTQIPEATYSLKKSNTRHQCAAVVNLCLTERYRKQYFDLSLFYMDG